MQNLRVVFSISMPEEDIYGDAPKFEKRLVLDRPFSGDAVQVMIAGERQTGKMRGAAIVENGPTMILVDGLLPGYTEEERDRLREALESDPSWKKYEPEQD